MNPTRPDPEFSVVVPVFNGARTLPKLFYAIKQVMVSMDRSFEVVFVDDSGGDDSWRMIVELKKEHGTLVRGFRLARNSGQQAATYCGLLQARGEWAVTLDDDLQAHPRDIATLWTHAQSSQCDVIYGVYATPRHGFVHRAGARVFRSLLRRVAPVFPVGSSFRLIRSEILRTLPARAGPWILVDAVLAWQTSDIGTVNVAHSRRDSGRSGYSFAKLAGIAWMLLVTYSKLPLRLMTAMGLLASMFSFGVGAYYLFRKLLVGAQLGFSAIIVTITFSAGLILLSLGILGEYISQIHTMGSGEPAFTVRTEI
jgi:glycosyltransferase involved in cell wall biosynthesis